MNHVSDEILMAYADGELTPEECQMLERLLRQNPVLRARLEPFIETRTQLASAFEHTLREPVPERLIAAIERARPSARPSLAGFPLGSRISGFIESVASHLTPGGYGVTSALAASMAALVVAGGAVGWIAGRTTSPSPSLSPSETALIVVSGPDLVAAGALAHALDANPSRTILKTDGGQTSIEPIVSFKTKTDTVCREYRVTVATAKNDSAGLACRNPNGTWRIAQHVETQKLAAAAPREGDYQTATGTNIPAIDAMVETMISGEAFGIDDEAQFLKGGARSAH